MNFKWNSWKVYIHAHVQLLESLLEERNNFLGQFFSHSESLRVQHDFSNKLSVRFGHGQTSEQLLQVIWQIGSPSISRIHGDEHSHIWIHPHLFSNQFHWHGTFQLKVKMMNISISYISFARFFSESYFGGKLCGFIFKRKILIGKNLCFLCFDNHQLLNN